MPHAARLDRPSILVSRLRCCDGLHARLQENRGFDRNGVGQQRQGGSGGGANFLGLGAPRSAPPGPASHPHLTDRRAAAGCARSGAADTIVPKTLRCASSWDPQQAVGRAQLSMVALKSSAARHSPFLPLAAAARRVAHGGRSRSAGKFLPYLSHLAHVRRSPCKAQFITMVFQANGRKRSG